MQALSESDLLRRPGDSYSTSWSIALNTTDVQSNNADWMKAMNDFLYWHAVKKSIFVEIPLHLCRFWSIVTIVAFIITFGFFDTNEIMFPALLEIKQKPVLASQNQLNKEVIASQNQINKDETIDFHFVRPHRFMYEMGFWCSLVLSIALVLIFVSGVFATVYGIFLAILLGVFAGGFAGCLVGMVMCGLFVQIHNATTLSNMLVEMCQTSHSDASKLERFKEWKEFYKTSVGALHVWSWRMTPLTAPTLIWIGMSILHSIVKLLFMYTTTMSEPDIIQSERMTMFQNSSVVRSQMTVLLAVTIGLLTITGAMSLISVRYQRLHILVATLGLPQHHLDDFNVLQKHNAALTINDIPITVRTTVSILKLLFVQSIIVVLSVVG